MTRAQFQITWKDVQYIAKQRYGQNLNKRLAGRLLADIEGEVRAWFNETYGDAISDSLTPFLPVSGNTTMQRVS